MRKLTPPDTWVERDLKGKFPHLAEMAIEAFEISNRAEEANELSVAGVSRLEEMCLDRSSMLRDWATQVVAALSAQFPEAEALLLELAEGGRSEVGVSAVAALHYIENTQLFERVASAGLRHKAKSVRALAAGKILTFKMRGLLPELERAVASETDRNCRESLEFSFLMLRDGHTVRNMDDGGIYISIAMHRSISSQLFSSEAVRKCGVEQLVDSLKTQANV